MRNILKVCVVFGALMCGDRPAEAQQHTFLRDDGTFAPAVHFVNIEDFGAKCDNSTDDTAAFTAAFASATSVEVHLPNARCYTSSGITIPNGSALVGDAWVGAGDAATYRGGSRINCAASVAVCVAAGGNPSTNTSASVRNVTIAFNGSPASTTIGLRVNNADNFSGHNIQVYNAGIGAYFFGLYGGVSAHLNGLYMSKIQDAWLVLDTWPEMKISNLRFGSVDVNSDVASNTHLRFTGGNLVNPAAASNTFVCTGCQFNAGALVNNWIEFVNSAGSIHPTIDAELFNFTDTHIENIHNGIYSDSSWNEIYNFSMSNTSFTADVTGRPFLDLNAATSVNNFNIDGGTFVNTTFTLQTGGSGKPIILSRNHFYGAVAISNTTAGSGGNVTLSNNKFEGTLTIDGTGWNSLHVIGSDIACGNETITATGNINVVDWCKVDTGPLVIANGTGNETHVELKNTSTNGRDYILVSGGAGGSFSGGSFGLWDGTAGAVRWHTSSTGATTFNSTIAATTAYLSASGSETQLELKNTSTNGRDYILVSGGSSGTFSGGKFGLWDNGAGAARWYTDSSGVTTFNGGVVLPGGTLLTTTAALTDGAASQTGTLTNAPTAGNPTKWIPINDNGTTRYIPAW